MTFVVMSLVFATGIVAGLVIGYILSRDEYLEESRKSLEKAIIESGIINSK